MYIAFVGVQVATKKDVKMEVLAESILNFWFGDLNQDGTASEENLSVGL